MKSPTKHKGFTLIEMIIVIIITMILVVASAMILSQQFRIFTTSQELLDADWQGRVALDRMVRELRDTNSVTNAEIDSVTFIDEQDDALTYQLSGSQLIHSLPTEQTTLADNIKAFELHYYNKNNIELGDTVSGTVTNSNLEQIRYITITLNISNIHTKITDFNLTTAVFLWNMRK